MDKAHDIQFASVDGEILTLKADGTEYKIDLCRQSKRLAAASPAARSNFIVSPCGYGIRWPNVDEDLSIDGLLGINHSSPLLKTTA